MAYTKGHGTLLQLSIASVFTTIAQRVTVTPPQPEREEIETTDLDSTWDTYLYGIRRGGEVELTAWYDPATATHAALWTAYNDGDNKDWKLILADAGAAEIAFSGGVISFQPGEASTDELVELNITIKVSGAVVITP